ncbi:tripartite tricarboxylate transporter permease [Oscillospiraceae bacterium 44-34]
MSIQGLLLAAAPNNILLGILGTLIGMIIGALPGLGANVAMTLALPLTFGWPADSAIILLMSLYCGATYGGSISAILLNTPGTPASGATVYDGYPLAKQGKGDIALGLSTMSSFVGGIVGAILLFTVTPLIAQLVLKFGPAESFLIAVLSLTIIGAMGEDKLLKGLISCGVGLMLSFIGIDVMNGFKRFTFGSIYMSDGLSSIIVMIGLFAISEMISLMSRGNSSVSEVLNAGKISNVLKGCRIALRHPVNLIRSSAIGAVIGAMPALGVTTAAFMSYMVTANSSKHPETFGQGEPEGVIAPECANNAVTATALMPTLTLGIPGSSVMAIVLGALTIQGIVPGPEIFSHDAQYVYAIMWALFFINTYMLVIGILGGGYISRITIIPTSILAPSVMVLCVVGAFAIQTQWQDIICAVIFGFVGYGMKRYHFSSLGLILGLILGPIAETSFHQALRIGGAKIFVKSPISIILILCIVFSIGYPIVKKLLKHKKAGAADGK